MIAEKKTDPGHTSPFRLKSIRHVLNFLMISKGSGLLYPASSLISLAARAREDQNR